MTAALVSSPQFSAYSTDEPADPLEAGEGLIPLSLAAMPWFRRAFDAAQVPISDYSFANNIAWHARQRLYYAEIDGCLCLFALREGRLTMQLPPLGPIDRAVRALDRCIDLMQRHNRDGCFEVLCVHDALVEAFLGSAWWRHTAAIHSDPPDYLYSTVDLVELRGSAYKSKRNDINQLLRAHADVRVVPLGPEHLAEVTELCGLWMAQRGPGDGALADLAFEESQAIVYAVAHMDTLGLTGMRLLVDGRTDAFILGERLLPTVAHVLFEKSDRERRGAAQLIFREYCRTLLECPLVNTGDALGSDSLAQNKQSYRPRCFGRKSSITSLHR